MNLEAIREAVKLATSSQPCEVRGGSILQSLREYLYKSRASCEVSEAYGELEDVSYEAGRAPISIAVDDLYAKFREGAG